MNDFFLKFYLTALQNMLLEKQHLLNKVNKELEDMSEYKVELNLNSFLKN